MKFLLPAPLMRLFIAFLAIAALGTAVFPQQKRFYISPDDHTDYFWTTDDVGYRGSFLRMLDFYLAQMNSTQGNPSDTQMRWNADGSLWMWEYEHNRTSAQLSNFMDRIRDGHLSVAANALVLVQGGAPAETVLRGMYYPGLMERRYNVSFPL